ncbi:MAG TPA: YicC/YloC family endoribonuclease, partial [Methylomirabilota bacterium]|nr:YicC/YloC family endoribonuclease [Methylomirabilota bacterium]
VTVEARSVNHRHLDVALRLPRSLAALELDARRLVQSRLERGRVDVTVQLSALSGAAAQRVQVDAALAREYVARARALAMELGLEGAPNLAWVLERPGVVRLEDPEPSEPIVPWPLLADALGKALDELVTRRTAEGERLVEALRSLYGELSTAVDVVASRAPSTAARREERLRERLRTLLAETAIDEARIVTEAAIWADKGDVTEELARLRAHLAEFTLLLDKGGPVGRPLDFLIQELNREVNTVASKADDLEMSQAALGAKGVLEKIREQVQNLE